MALNINNENFQEVTATDKLVVIDFWAEWCGPCRMMTPIVEELASEFADRAVIGKCNVDESNEITSKFMVRNIPTIIFIKNGQMVDKQVGACSKVDLQKKVEKNL